MSQYVLNYLTLSASYVGSFGQNIIRVAIAGFVAKEQVNRFKSVEDVTEWGDSPGVFLAACSEEPMRTKVSFRSYIFKY